MGELIRHDPVDFFGHQAIIAAQARLHMGDADIELRRGQGAGQRGIGIAINQHPIWLFFEKDLFDGRQHSPCLKAVQTGTDIKVVLWFGDFEFSEKYGRHVVIIVLAGMNKNLLDDGR